jgi:hypothetical protein
MRRLAILLLATLAGSASAQPRESGFEALAYGALQNVCLPLLRGQKRLGSLEEEQAFVAAHGLKTGMSSDQLALFPPPHDTALSRATLISGERNGSRFLLAIGGAERSCRLFVERKAGQARDAGDLAKLFTAADGWQPAKLPAAATARLGFTGGDLERPSTIALILLANQLPGIAYTAVVMTR